MNCFQCNTELVKIGTILWTTLQKQEEFKFCEECSKRVAAEIRQKKYKKTAYPIEAFWIKWKEADGLYKGPPKVERHYARLSEKIRREVFIGLDAVIANRNMLRANNAPFIPYMKYPATWLNQECWKDEFITEKEVQNEKTERANAQFASRNQQSSDAIWELFETNEARED